MKKLTSIYSTYIYILATAVAVGLEGGPAMAQPLSNTPAATAPGPQIVAPASTAGAPALAFGVSEVVKMYQGGISKEVIVSYINNTVLPFHLTADDIIYLKNLGVPEDVTSALINRDGELQRQSSAAYQQAMAVQQQQQATAAAAAANQAAAGQAAPPVVMPTTAPPQVAPYADSGPTVIAAPPVVYPDYYPYYGYPYYGPDIIVGGGWGWGWGPGWGRGGFGRCGFGGRGGFGGGHR